MSLFPARPFCLIRHGQTDANRDRLVAGQLAAQLTDLGREGARALAALDWPQPLAVFASPQDRAYQTACLAFPDITPTVVEGLRERNWGIYEGRPIAELPEREAHPQDGEGWDEMLDRIAAALRLCLEQAGEALPVMVAHSGVVRAVRALTGGEPHGPSIPNTLPLLFVPQGDIWVETPLFHPETGRAAYPASPAA